MNVLYGIVIYVGLDFDTIKSLCPNGIYRILRTCMHNKHHPGDVNQKPARRFVTIRRRVAVIWVLKNIRQL